MENIASLESFIFSTVALTARIIGVFIFAPGFSSKAIPRQFKLILSFSLATILTQYVNYNITDLYSLLAYVICETLAGTLIGLVSSLFMQSIQVSGGILDSLIGTGIFQMQDTSGVMSGVSSKLIEYAALILFFVTNSHLYLINIISSEMNFLNLFESFKTGAFIEIVSGILTFIFLNGVHLSLPFILILLLIDISLGLLNKSFSSFNVFLFSIPIKLLLFLVILFYYVVAFSLNFENLMGLNLEFLNSLMFFINPRG